MEWFYSNLEVITYAFGWIYVLASIAVCIYFINKAFKEGDKKLKERITKDSLFSR